MKKIIEARTKTVLCALEITEPELPHKQFSGRYDCQPTLVFPPPSITQSSDFQRVSLLSLDKLELEAQTEEELLTRFYQIVQGAYGEILEKSIGSPY